MSSVRLSLQHAIPATPAWLHNSVRTICPRPYLWVLGVSIVYGLAFFPFYWGIGPAVGALGILVSVLAGFLLPSAAGLAFGLLFSLLNWWLYAQVEPFTLPVHLGGTAIHLLSCVGGAQARRAWDLMHRQRRALKAAHRQLLETQAMLVQSAKLASLGELASGVGHELNQPLQIIHLATEAARRQLASTASPGQDHLAKHLNMILAQTTRATAIIHQLRTLGRTGDLGGRFAVDVNAIVQDSLLLFRNRWREAGIMLNVDLAHNLPAAFANAGKIEEALLPLYFNATDALEGCAQRMIQIRTFATAGRTCVEVKDSGCGIAPDVIGRVFDPFFTTKPVGEGRGLGLSLSHRIATDFGGSLTVNSTVGQGATFRLALPSAADVAPAAKLA